MSGSLSALMLTNPELASALRRQQQGQQFAQMAGDGSPIQSPWQGVNRIAQGLIGGLLIADGDKTAKDAQAKSDALLKGESDYVHGTSPAVSALMAPAPAPAPAPNLGAGVNTAPQSLAAQFPDAPTDLVPRIEAAAKNANLPPSVFAAALKQESNFGRASPNIGQVIPSTAANPGYGAAPLPPDKINDPDANLTFSADYMARKARAAGLDPNNPDHWPQMLTGYNGGGDPKYVEHVMRYLPQAGTMLTGGQGGPPAPSPTGNALAGPSANMETAKRYMAASERLSASSDPRAQKLAANYEAQAKMLAGQEQWHLTTVEVNGVKMPAQVSSLTGKTEFLPADATGNWQRQNTPEGPVYMDTAHGNKPMFMPAPRTAEITMPDGTTRVVNTATGGTVATGALPFKEDMSGNKVNPVTAKPVAPTAPFPGTNPEMQNQRTIAQLDAKMAAGQPLSTEEMSAYRLAHQSFQANTAPKTPEQAALRTPNADGQPPSPTAVASNMQSAQTTGTDVAKTWGAIEDQAQMVGRRTETLNRAEDYLTKFKTGPLSEQRLWAQRLAREFGAKVDDSTTAGEALKQNQRILELALTPKGQGSVTESERGLFREQVGVLLATPEGARELIANIRRLDKIDADVAGIYRDNAKAHGGNPDPVSVRQEVADYMGKIRQAAPAQAAPQQQAQPGQYRVGQTATGPGGAKVQFDGKSWVPVK